MKFIFVLSVFICLVTSVFAQKMVLEGEVTDDKNVPIEYATIILLGSDSAQVAGAVSDAGGKFLISALRGKYTLAIHYLGYESYSQRVELSDDKRLAPIKLTASSVAVQDVVVKAQFIKREADRFVVNVAASPSAIGKDALEVLKSAPGVWVKQDGIMINGKSGSRVMVNERMLNMEADELNVYLKSIRAEDILKIEVIPVSGADYDADTKGGVIKITLKRQRNDGLEGSVGVSYRFGELHPRVSPTFNLNYRQDKLSLYTKMGYTREKKYAVADERVDYLTVDRVMESQVYKYDKENNYNATLGAIYDISERQTVGFEFGVGGYDCLSDYDGTSSLISAARIDNASRYGEQRDNKRYNMTLNYIFKLDTLGSMFKIIGDMNSRKSDIVNDYFNRASIVGGGAATDTTYRNIGASDYAIYSASADLTLMLSKATKVQTGLKFNYNVMDNNALYEGISGGQWVTDNARSGRDDYSERIAAAYVILSTRVGRTSLSAGLRGEYTNMVPHSDKQTDMSAAKQNYFSLFPNVNISIPLNKTESSSLILAYARTISRPQFWALNPFRTQLSEYSYYHG